MPSLHVIVLAVIAMLLLAILPATASRFSSDQLPQDYLNACDDRAKAFGAYDRRIADAADDLTAMGVFKSEELHDVKIGFCDLRKINGPMATTSCTDDIILLDSGYAARDQGLVMKATLAHEMKHVLQHRELKEEFGEDYCFTDRYVADKSWMEEEADAFGNAVAALFFTGRPVEIRNDCPVAVSVYLEADNPISSMAGALQFMTAPPRSTIASSERAISKFFKLYAETEPYRGGIKVWRDARMAHTRIIEGGRYGLKSLTLPNAARSTGPFRMTLSCDQ